MTDAEPAFTAFAAALAPLLQPSSKATVATLMQTSGAGDTNASSVGGRANGGGR